MTDVNSAIPSMDEAAIETAVQLLSAFDSASRATVIASALAGLISDSACIVHLYQPQNGHVPWTIAGIAGEISLVEAQHAGSWLFAFPDSFPADGQIFDKTRLNREVYAHFNVSRSVGAIAYLPVEHDGQLTAVLEIVLFSGAIKQRQLEDLAPIVRLAATALLSGEYFEQQHHTLLDSIHRMSQLYDLEKSLNATLELDAVIAMVPSKAIAMLPCQAINLWLFDGSDLRMVAGEGADDTVELGLVEAPGEGYVADMAEEGEPLLIHDPDDERLRLRNARRSEGSSVPPVSNAVAVALMQDGAEVGVLEAPT
jgi:hypothetical protein